MVARDEQLAALLRPSVEALGFELWGVELLPRGKRHLLRVFIDSPDGISVDNCAAVSHQVSGVLDVEDPVAGEYTLEVSSPGMDRPLYTLEQFRRYIGEQVKVKLRMAFEGRRNFNGELTGVEDDDVVVAMGEEEYLLPFEWVERAHVVPQFADNKPGKPGAKKGKAGKAGKK